MRPYITRLPFPICEMRLVSERVSLPIAPARFTCLVLPRLLELMVTRFSTYDHPKDSTIENRLFQTGTGVVQL
jgi:hypothetical protein